MIRVCLREFIVRCASGSLYAHTMVGESLARGAVNTGHWFSRERERERVSGWFVHSPSVPRWALWTREKEEGRREVFQRTFAWDETELRVPAWLASAVDRTMVLESCSEQRYPANAEDIQSLRVPTVVQIMLTPRSQMRRRRLDCTWKTDGLF